MMQLIFKKWQEKLSQFESSVDKELKEIRECKADIQRMRQEADFELHKGRYIHDDERIILSAPEIIIGHVDRNGMLIGNSGSTVIVRGSQIGLQGAGDGGLVEMRAPGIRQIAEDPGIDGEEHVVGNRSEVVSQARHIVIHSQDAEGMFPMEPTIPSGSGVRIHADKAIEVDASMPGPTLKKAFMEVADELKKTQKDLKAQSDSHKSSFEQMTSSMEKLLREKDMLMNKPAVLRAAYGSIEKLNGYIEQLSLSLSQEVCQYAEILSQLAETSRQLKCLNEQSDNIKENEYATKAHDTHVSVRGERIDLATRDGEGDLREDPVAQINLAGTKIHLDTVRVDGSLIDDGEVQIKSKSVVVDSTDTENEVYDEKTKELKSGKYPVAGQFVVMAKNVSVEAVDMECKNGVTSQKELAKDSKISLHAQNIDVNTAKVQNVEVGSDGKMTKAEFPADGEVRINSKDIILESLDNEFDPNGLHERKEKALSKGSQIKMRTERINMQATTTDGKATGGIRMNAKDLEMWSVDLGQNDPALTKDGVMAVMSERIYLGYSKEESLKSHKVQAWADKITLLGSKVVQAVQGKKKTDDAAFLQLKEGNAQLKGKATELHGDTEVVGDTTLHKTTVGDIEIQGELKSNYIGGGVTAGPSPKSDLKLDNVSQEEYEVYQEHME